MARFRGRNTAYLIVHVVTRRRGWQGKLVLLRWVRWYRWGSFVARR